MCTRPGLLRPPPDVSVSSEKIASLSPPSAATPCHARTYGTLRRGRAMCRQRAQAQAPRRCHARMHAWRCLRSMLGACFTCRCGSMWCGVPGGPPCLPASDLIQRGVRRGVRAPSPCQPLPEWERGEARLHGCMLTWVERVDARGRLHAVAAQLGHLLNQHHLDCGAAACTGALVQRLHQCAGMQVMPPPTHTHNTTHRRACIGSVCMRVTAEQQWEQHGACIWPACWREGHNRACVRHTSAHAHAHLGPGWGRLGRPPL